MKKLTMLIVWWAIVGLSFAQESSIMDKPKVDERVELLSIVARLAEYREYSAKDFELYINRIEEHFDPYKEHEVIAFAKKIREERGVSYDAVMSMAVHLDENLNPRSKFTDEIPESRWGKDNANEFVRLLKKFYTDAGCKAFFENNKDLYKEVSDRFLPIYNRLDIDWYSRFYGKEPSEKFIIVTSLANGRGNYGPSYTPLDGKKEVYAIICIAGVDSLGMPVYNENYSFPTLLHEFNHSFVNYLLDANRDKFEKSGKTIFASVKEIMAQQAYGDWAIVLNEALVRASVIKYMKDHNLDSSMVNEEVKTQLKRGFYWIRQLVEELEIYDSQRDKYPTLESYVPNLIQFYKKIADEETERDKKRPKVLSITEFKNGNEKVSSGITTITINFDRPLLGEGYSIYTGNKGDEAFPTTEGVSYSEDKKSVIMRVKLEKNKEYQFVMKGNHFKSLDGEVAIKDYEVNFRTEK